MSPTELLLTRPMTAAIADKLADVRSLFANLDADLDTNSDNIIDDKLDAYLIPAADEHLNEYLPAARQRRIWVTGFTGSAGDFLLGQESAWLFVDSRYYEQAELEVNPALIQVSKVGLEGHKTLDETLEEWGRTAQQAGKTLRVGLDPFTVPLSEFRNLEHKLGLFGVQLVPVNNLVDRVRAAMPWQQVDPVPAIAESPVFHLPLDWTGEALGDKLQRLRTVMQQKNVQILPITKLDQIAWLYNLRGWDIPYNPVFIAYAIVTLDQAFLLTNVDRISPRIRDLIVADVQLLPYEQYAPILDQLLTHAALTPGVPCRVWLDPKRSTTGTYNLLRQHGSRPQIVELDNPIEGMKARKNAVEIAQMQQANLKASRAKTRTLKWLGDQIAQGLTVSEADVATTVEGFYAEEEGFQGLSFNTIAGAGANSSIVHYGTPDAGRSLQSGEFLLLDSGAQYAAGTTDDTRTIVVGAPTAAQIACYTEVLKAHINCAMQRFPKGTTGAQLDGITRSTLWHANLDYGHGTGHGVGAFLNVHEGPNGISKKVSQTLEPGMVTSIEPGFYQPGWGGIRLENLYIVKELPPVEASAPEGAPAANGAIAIEAQSASPPWYGFEALTYIPFERQLIDQDRLDPRQRQWLEDYSQAILDRLGSQLNAEELAWLQDAVGLSSRPLPAPNPPVPNP
jgi:Xaa-Pro aminopeptidase